MLRWSGLGATHATELLAVFDVYRTRFGALLTAAADQRAALRVSNQVQRRWRSFSRTGVPGDDWPAYTDRRPRCHGLRPQVPHRVRSASGPPDGMGWLLFGALTWHAGLARYLSTTTEDFMDSVTERVIERPSDLTASWLAAAIGAGAVADFAVERIGTGQMSECYRVQLQLRRMAPPTPADRSRWC